MSDSLRGNLILDPAGCHEAVFHVSRPPWKDRRPSPRRRQTLSSPPRDSVRDPCVDRRRQLIPVRPHIYPRASTSVAQAFLPEMAEGPSLHDYPRDLVATRSGWRRAVFREHARALCAHENIPRAQHRHIAVDGKTLCSSFDQFEDRKAAHVLSAFASGLALILAHVECDEKSNEIPAVQKLIAELGLPGSLLTVDAMHCQKKPSKRPLAPVST